VIDLAMEIPELQRLAQLMGGRLSLRGLVEGSLSGSHRSPRQGVSLDFAQHRDYVPGDDLRHLDWRAYAKNDRYVIKQYEEETNLRAFMVVDRSNSMNYQGGGRAKKGVYAAQIAAALSWMFLLQGEAVGALTFGSTIDSYLPARSRRDHFWRVLDVLQNRPWLEETNAMSALGDLAERLPPKGVVFLISDGFDFQHDQLEGESSTLQRESFSAIALNLKRRGYHVIFLHTLDPYELDFPFDQLTLFEGLEGEESIKVDPDGVREAYLQEMKTFTQRLQRAALSGGVSYCAVRTDETLDRALLRLLEEVSAS
jgi:uncharacterized protein (DUF58 family)